MPETPVVSNAVQAPSSDAPHGVDVQKLADKVYRLLLADARVGRARGDSSIPQTRDREL